MFVDACSVFVITAKVDGRRVWFKRLKRRKTYYKLPIGWSNDGVKFYYHTEYNYT